MHVSRTPKHSEVGQVRSSSRHTLKRNTVGTRVPDPVSNISHSEKSISPKSLSQVSISEQSSDCIRDIAPMAFYSGKLMVAIRGSALNVHTKVITHSTKLSTKEHRVIIYSQDMDSEAQSTNNRQQK